MTATATPQAPTSTSTPLGDGDGRCDGCGYFREEGTFKVHYLKTCRATFRAHLPDGGSLDFCNSHMAKHRDALVAAGADITELPAGPS